MGYVPMVTISSAMITLRVIDKAVELEIRDDLLFIESCADSTQTMIAIFSGLNPPAPENNEIRYCTEIIPVNMLSSITEDAFVHPGRKMPGAGTAALMSEDEPDTFFVDSLNKNTGKMQSGDGEMLSWDEGEEEMPGELSFMESYYGNNQTEQKAANSMLDGDLSGIQTPTLSRAGSYGSSVFTETAVTLDPEPLKFVEDHFARSTSRRRGKRSLNQDAVDRYGFSQNACVYDTD
jgi:autophagy-related protein 2